MNSAPPTSAPIAPRARRVALLGAGYIADWHAKALLTLRNIELVAVCDTARGRAARFAASYRIPHVYESLEDMLSSETLDAVHVLLPPDHHYGAARSILEAGVGALLEKPMCLRAEECAALQELADARGLRLGVNHNFLFSEPYERLREDVHSGVLGRIDHVTIAWHRELPQATHGPFDSWMLRGPGNVMLEIGSHSAAHLLDLVGPRCQTSASASNPIDLPSGQPFYRRWQVEATSGSTAATLLFSFVPGFDEHYVHVRGSLASATADLITDTYHLWQHGPVDQDLDRYRMVVDQARHAKWQARRTLMRYVMSKVGVRNGGNPYGRSIARALEAFYEPERFKADNRGEAGVGTEAIRLCERWVASAPAKKTSVPHAPLPATEGFPSERPRVAVLGATGFIGQELVRQLVAAARPVRVLSRNPEKLGIEIQAHPLVEVVRGDVSTSGDLDAALRGMEAVVHLARAHVKTWADYLQEEIGATQRVAEAALRAGVRRLVYTGTIASYYTGSPRKTIDEGVPLDPQIDCRDYYARAKALSEHALIQLFREKGLPLVIVRPGIVIGRGGSPFHWGVGMWHHGTVCELWGKGGHKLPFVLVQDVARGLIAAIDKSGIEGESFNLVGDPWMSGSEYLDELDRCAGFRLQRRTTSASAFYFRDLAKWLVKIAVRHPDRRRPSLREWRTREQCSPYDCSKAKTVLGWSPTTDRRELLRLGIEEPMNEVLR